MRVKLELELDSRTAESLLFALKLRACQTRVPADERTRMESLRQQFNAAFTKAFRWDVCPARLSADTNDIRVNVVSRRCGTTPTWDTFCMVVSLIYWGIIAIGVLYVLVMSMREIVWGVA